MARIGYDSMQAAMIYQHATTRADLAIAAALNEEMRSVLERRSRRARVNEKARYPRDARARIVGKSLEGQLR